MPGCSRNQVIRPARRTVWQEIDRTPTLQINQDRSVPLATSPGPIVDAKDTGRLGRRQRRCAHQTEERRAAGHHAEASSEPRTRTPTERESDLLQCRTKEEAVAGAATGQSQPPVRRRCAVDIPRMDSGIAAPEAERTTTRPPMADPRSGGCSDCGPVARCRRQHGHRPVAAVLCRSRNTPSSAATTCSTRRPARWGIGIETRREHLQ